MIVPRDSLEIGEHSFILSCAVSFPKKENTSEIFSVKLNDQQHRHHRSSEMKYLTVLMNAHKCDFHESHCNGNYLQVSGKFKENLFSFHFAV